MKRCPECGTLNEEYNVYCYSCGYDFDGEAEASGEDR